MQLFHISSELFHVQGNTIKIFPVPELISQLRKVLRVEKGDCICVQFNDKNSTRRYTISIINRTDKELEGSVEEDLLFQNNDNKISILVAMPNKREKAELIVQKLTEIGINYIGFWVSDHSIIRQRNVKKSERLEKISREAVEQSRGTILPEIKFLDKDDVIKYCKGKEIYLANMNGSKIGEYKTSGLELCGIVGPEGGFSSDDLKLFADAKIVDLGNNILRMETAAIILAWLLKNR